jgi:hypothetical protein
VSRAEVTRLQVTLARDRERGTRIGAVVGGLAGGLLVGGVMASGNEWGRFLSPLGALFGAVSGGAVGAGTGYVFAPPAWSDVSVTRAP